MGYSGSIPRIRRLRDRSLVVPMWTGMVLAVRVRCSHSPWHNADAHQMQVLWLSARVFRAKGTGPHNLCCPGPLPCGEMSEVH
jgi:hypothetical protein